LRKIIIILSLFISWNSFSQLKKSPDRILTYGLPNYNYQKAMEHIGKKWGIELYPVAACMVSQKLIDSVKIVNQKLWKKMDIIYGPDSEKKFRKETIAEMKRIIEVQNIFDSDRKIRKLKSKIEKIKKQTSSNLDSISADGNIYYWTIYSIESKINSEYKRKLEFKVKVNLIKRKTEIG